MKRQTPKNAFYAQSGGVSAVINASACGVIETARKHRGKIGKVYAGRHGIVGALTEDLIDTGKESAATIRGSAPHARGRLRLGALQARGSRQEPRPVRAADRGLPRPRHRLLLLQRRQRFHGHRPQGVADRRPRWAIRSSASACPRPSTTIWRCTDCCPGFGSAAKYIAVSTREAALDVLSMARTSTKVFVLEVMGRHAGWIAAAGGLAGSQAPAMRRTSSCSRRSPSTAAPSSSKVKSLRRVTTAIAWSWYRKGCADADGKFLAEAGTKDAFGHAQLGRRRAGGRADDAGGATATSSTGRSPTICSAPRATSPRRWTSNRPMRSARRRWSSRSRARTP